MLANGDTARVLIVVENMPAPFDRRVWQEATALRDAGWRVAIICPVGLGYERREERVDGIDIFRHPMPAEASGVRGYLVEYGAALLQEFRLVWKVYRHGGFAVIHACNPPDTIFAVAALFKFLRGTRFIFDHHDLSPELYEAKFGQRGAAWGLLRMLEHLSFRLADVSIATNNSFKAIAVGRGGMRPERVFVVRTGPDLDRVRLVPPVAALKMGRRYLVGYVGTMGEQDGLELLLNAAHHIVFGLGRDDVHFGLVGGGASLDRLRRRAVDLGIANFVTFTGWVDPYDELLLQVLSTADVCVNPDAHNPMNDQSTMIKIMEYMAVGKPIVQFDLKEGRFSAGESSLYARPNDPLDLGSQIVALLDDPARRERMGRYGRQRVEAELSWPHEIPKLLDAYRSALGAGTMAGSATEERGERCHAGRRRTAR